MCPARIDSFGREPLDESRIVAVGDETNFLALGLVGIREAQRAGARANFGLGHRAERKKRARKFILAQG